MPKKKAKHTTRKMSVARRILADFNDVAATFPRVQGLVEIDITEGRKKIREYKEKENYNISLTSWIAKCISKAVKENPKLNSFRKRGKRIVIFEHVDISIMVEVITKDGKHVPFNHVIRKVETKSVKEITDEIRSVQTKKIEETEQITRDSSSFSGLIMLIPRKIRQFFMKKMIKNPFYIQKLIGTVGITSLGMFAKNIFGYAVPFPDRTCNVALGGIQRVGWEVDGKLQPRDILSFTFLIDHNLVDGAPIARFISRVAELCGEAYGLQDITKAD
jgi:pyruvate/2-oxoglutarate dehydrogenase complex dihydrolipoamide acyltransferase (E2) component